MCAEVSEVLLVATQHRLSAGLHVANAAGSIASPMSPTWAHCSDISLAAGLGLGHRTFCSG